MSARKRRVLIVDDQPEILQGVQHIVESLGYEASTAQSAEEALDLALVESPDLVITDLNLPGRNGIELLDMLEERGIDSTLIVLTGFGTIESAIDATRKGAYDYLLKPIRPKELQSVIRKAVERASLREEVQLLRSEMQRSGRFQEMVGNSTEMHAVYRLIEQVAPTNAEVLIVGESGTGKELVARAIHACSTRSSEQLVAVNCAAIPGELLESEMFGHERGAFTGAVRSRRGCFEMANGGTLFLDEIGEMSTRLQSKLLRALETHTIRRVGSERDQKIDARLIAATNVALDERIASGEFRSDLYFRLNVFQIELPPLRRRPEDIPLLVECFAERFSEDLKRDPLIFGDDALEAMQRYDWPGNVRELRNVVHRISVISGSGEVKPAQLPPQIRPRIRSAPGTKDELQLPIGVTIAEAEEALILRTLEACEGNKTKAAAHLGISTKTLYSKLKRYGRFASDSDSLPSR